MSLFRPLWLDDILKPRPAATPRLRGLKGFEPHHVVASQDPLYGDDPEFWMLDNFLGGVVANLGHIGVGVPNDDSLVCVVDSILFGTAATDALVVDYFPSTQAFISDTQVIRRNRRESTHASALERVGLFRISDNSVPVTGTRLFSARVTLNSTGVPVPVGFRLFAGEQLVVRNATINTALEAAMFGRLTRKGQR